ncbi:hypothetical protein ACHQM5_002317 [Ranunculus cassubicifolius]
MKPIYLLMFCLFRFNNPFIGMHCFLIPSMFVVGFCLPALVGSRLFFTPSSFEGELEVMYVQIDLFIPGLGNSFFYISLCLAPYPCCVVIFSKYTVGVCSLCRFLFFHQDFEVITLASGRIFRLRSAPSASSLRTRKLTSSLEESVVKLTRSAFLLMTGFRYRQYSDAAILALSAQPVKDPVGSLKTSNQWSHLCVFLGFKDVPKEKHISTISAGSLLLKIMHSLETILLGSMLFWEGQCGHPRAPVLPVVKGWTTMKHLLLLMSMLSAFLYFPLAMYNFY